MTPSTIERAFQLARSGEVADLFSLKRRLKLEGCRAVDALLAPRSLNGHLQAICTAAFKGGAESRLDMATIQGADQRPHSSWN